MTTDTQHKDPVHKTVTVTVDGELVAGVPRRTTPNEILRLAGIDPATHYLVRINGRHQEPFNGEGDKEIAVHERETFVSVSTGPTQTS
ncbi:hypothetical protein OIE43_21045 [Streptomyces pseudovenezuelae]|uniref:Multi-ubiquitin domain-containing protein n=1 Tax=Streptomyces pseudovenezuelae TaxID=67350 RepID=A0ABZ1X8Z5_9ACTN|nr:MULTISPECIES: hypothetical protein [Streptomyces aurantiacus group]